MDKEVWCPVCSPKRHRRLWIFRRDNWVCHLCGHPCPSALDGRRSNWAPTIDHLVPRSECKRLGWTSEQTHGDDNVRTAHRYCNTLRSNTPLPFHCDPPPGPRPVT